MLRFVPAVTIALLIGPVCVGLLGIAAPAFGYLPAIGGTRADLSPFARLFAEPAIATSIALSIATGLAATLLTFVIVVAFLAAWSQTRLFRIMRAFISPLLSVPHAAAAFGLAFLIAPSGWLVRLVSPWATGWDRPPDLLILADPWGLSMIAGLVIKEIPFLLLVSIAALPQTDPQRTLRVTASMGYGTMAGFVLTVLPRLYRQIRLPIFAIIAYSVSVVDVALILGPTTPAPLAVRILAWTNDPDIGMRFVAAAGSLLLLAATLFAIGVWVALEKVAGRFCLAMAVGGWRLGADRIPAIGAAFTLALAVGAVLLGGVVLVLWSIAGRWRFPEPFPSALTTRHWMSQTEALLPAFETTVWVALAATAIALVLVLGCLERESRSGRRGRDWSMLVLYLPLLVPQISFLFGLQVVFILFHVDATMVAVTLSHMIFVLPYMFLALSDPWRALDPRYAHTAAALGRNPAAIFWRIRLPMLTAPILTAIAIGLAVSIGQYLPTVIAGGGRYTTITTEAVALAAGGDRRIIGVTALVQMVLPFAGFWIALSVPAMLFRHRQGMRAGA